VLNLEGLESPSDSPGVEYLKCRPLWGWWWVFHGNFSTPRILNYSIEHWEVPWELCPNTVWSWVLFSEVTSPTSEQGTEAMNALRRVFGWVELCMKNQSSNSELITKLICIIFVNCKERVKVVVLWYPDWRKAIQVTTQRFLLNHRKLLWCVLDQNVCIYIYMYLYVCMHVYLWKFKLSLNKACLCAPTIWIVCLVELGKNPMILRNKWKLIWLKGRLIKSYFFLP
jgi:hypothetical protein